MTSKLIELEEIGLTHVSLFRSVTFSLPAEEMLYVSRPVSWRDRVFSLQHRVRVATKRQSNHEQRELMRRWSDVTTMNVMLMKSDGIIELDADLLLLKARAYTELMLEVHAVAHGNGHERRRHNSEQAVSHLFSHPRNLDKLTRYIADGVAVANDICSTLKFLCGAVSSTARLPAMQSAVEVAEDRLVHLVSRFRSCDTRLKGVVTRTAAPECLIDELFRGIQRRFNSLFPCEFRIGKDHVCAHAAAIDLIQKFDRMTFLGTLIEPFHPLFLWQVLSQVETALPPWYSSARSRLMDQLVVERAGILPEVAPRTTPPTVLTRLNSRQREIIRELYHSAPALITQKELQRRVHWSRGSVQPDIAELESLSIVHRPNGPNSGYQVTETWREYFTADPSQLPVPRGT